METQSQIARTLAKPENLRRIEGLAAKLKDSNRFRFSRAVCDLLGFQDPLGRPQVSSCFVALRDLERRKLVKLPAPSISTGGYRPPKHLGKAVAQPQGVPEDVKDVRDLELVLVETADQRAVWNKLIIREHPQGERQIMGRTLRYLIGSKHGYLGALGFSSSALQLRARDKWIGWNTGLRRQYLERVVGLSRFLIRPSVQCKNLASKVLGMVVKRFCADYQARYGLEVWLLESFVDREAHEGTSFRAANWIVVGQTSGRGRQDRWRKASESRKDIYVYQLRRDFRRKLGVDVPLAPLEVAEGLDGEHWAKNEFSGAVVGHIGRVDRLVQMAEAKGKRPHGSWLQAVDGDRHQLKCIYRFIDQPDKSAVTMEGIMRGHRERTERRMAAQSVVLCPQDSTDLNFSDRLECEGLGLLGTNQTKTKSQGLRLHSVFPLTDDGIPLGVLWAQIEARKELSKKDKRRDPRTVPIEKKETYRWVQGVEACIEASKRMPQTMVVNIDDREGDFFELFDRVRNEPRVHLLVRAKHDRRRKPEPSLFEQVRGSEVRARYELKVPRKSARRKKGNRSITMKMPSRTARVELRYAPCKIHPPSFGVSAKKKPVPAWIIHVLEPDPPKGAEGVEWFLLTTLTVDSVATARRLVKWYCLRWRIEDWHGVLKSGCELETHANRTVERLRRVIAIDLVVGYRILLMALLGRELPDLPAEVLFSEIEIRVLSDWVKKKKKRWPAGPLTTIAAAIAVLAAMGGYLGRKSDPPPGPKILRRGYIRLQDFCEAYGLLLPDLRPDEEPGHG